MIDSAKDQMSIAVTQKELRELIREEHRGPEFRTGELVEIKGYAWKITGLQKSRMHLKLVGPAGKGGAQHG